ncbi:hypothetical protein D3C74_336640 [compost metagenome]
MVAAPVGELPQGRRAVALVERDVLDEAHTVAHARGLAQVDRLGDRRDARRLARVDRHGEVLVGQVLPHGGEARGREAVLGPGDVEPDDAVAPVGDRELGDLLPAVGVPHRGHELAHADGAPLGRGEGNALLEPGLDRVHGVLQAQAALHVLLGGPALLGVDDAVRGQVEDGLAGDAREGLGRLHDGDGVVEGLEVAHERARVGRLDEPGAQRVRLGRGQVVPDRGGQLDDRRGAQPAVEVVVEDDLGERGDRRDGLAH